MFERASPFREVCQALAARQHGVVARFQLLNAGIPRGTIDAGARSGFLFTAIRSVFSVGRPSVSVLGIWMACVLASGPRAAICGRTAAVAWGFRDRPESPVFVARPGSNQHRRRAELKAHGHNSRVWLQTQRCRWLREEHLTRFQGIPILRIEPLLLRLAGQLSQREFQYAFWEADRTRGLSQKRLDACFELSVGLKGGSAFREAVDCRLPQVKEALSLLEVLLIDLSRAEHLPPPVVNRNDAGHLVDFRWLEQKVAVEVDGYEFHRGRGAFERDRERDNDLRARDWIVLRFTYRMIRYRPDYVKETIANALGNAA